jgi:hypothetical protein
MPLEKGDNISINVCPWKHSMKQWIQVYDYEETKISVGRKKIQEMEQMMHDNLQQRIKTVPFRLRKTFSYFGQDRLGGINF